VEAVSNDLLGPSSGSDVPIRRTEDDWRGVFRALATGHMSALEDLYDAVAAKLYGLALWRTGSEEDAADVVHDVFVRVVDQGPRLANVRNPKAWLLTVAHRAAVDVTRRRRRRQAESLEDCPFLAANAVDGVQRVDAARASQLLAGLPPAQRDAVYLRHFADCSFAEIGEIVGVPKFTAASRYRIGIGKLRRLMEGDHETTR
jgi:RNA polymerase sigma-70 factor (ECF subfamily)